METGRQIAVSGLTRVVYMQMKKSNDFILKYKKGDKYKDFNLRFPFIHTKEYEENQYIEHFWPFTKKEVVSESFLKKNYKYLLFKDGEVYEMPYVNIVYLDGKEKWEYFRTNEEALARYEELVNTCDLKEIVKDVI